MMRGVLLGLALLVAGCSSSGPSGGGTPGKEAELTEVGSMLVLYSGQHRKGPAKAADLAGYEQGAPLGYPAVKSGEVVVVWGATMPGEGDLDKGTTAVVAYEKKTPKEGGLVLLHNGKVQAMTAAEFAAAPKAK